MLREDKHAPATPLTPTQRDYVDMISRSGEALLNILNDILDYSKVEADARVTAAHPSEVALRAESRLLGDLELRQFGLLQQCLGVAHALHRDVQVRRQSGRMLEHAREVELAHVHLGGESLDVERLRDMSRTKACTCMRRCGGSPQETLFDPGAAAP